MTKKIIIPYFPKGLKFITPVLFGGGAYLVFVEFPVWGVVLLLLGIIVLTTNYVTEIDLEEKVCHDYLSFLFFPIDKDSKKFNGFDRIIIAKGDYAQTVNTRAQSRQFDWTDYTGTLIFDDGETLDLLTKTSKQELLVGLKGFADFLKVGVEDRSTADYYWIDMDRVDNK